MKTATQYKRHPIASSMYLPSAEFQDDALNDSIAKRGIIHPIVLCDGMVLDGWRRLQAAQRNNKDMKTIEYDGEKTTEALTTYLIAVNVHRRHYTALQRALLAARVLMDRRGIVKGGPQEFTTGDAAKMFCVSNPYVALCMRVIASKNTLLIRKVENGQATRDEIDEVLPPDPAFARKSDSNTNASPEPEDDPRTPAEVKEHPSRGKPDTFVRQFNQLDHEAKLAIVSKLQDEIIQLLNEVGKPAAVPAPRTRAKR